MSWKPEANAAKAPFYLLGSDRLGRDMLSRIIYGTRVSLLDDWKDEDVRSEFLHAVRDGSCGLFSTVLSPDHNAAHANHFHLDLAARPLGWTVCR